MKRPRFTLRTLMALPVLAGVSIWLYLQDGCQQTGVGIGFRSIPLRFLVIDAKDGTPIALAMIRLHESLPEYSFTTSADGQAEFLYQDAPVATRFYRFRPIRQTVNYRWAVSVKAEGYENFIASLRDLTSDPCFHNNTTPPPILIRLQRNSAKP